VDLTSYAELAVRLVNTGGGGAGDSRPDELASTDSYRALMADQDYPGGLVSPADLDALRRLRADLRLIFDACVSGADEDAARWLNALLTRHPIHPEVVRHDDGAWHLHHARSGSVADQYAAGAVLGLTRVITEHGTSRLRRCEAAGCPNAVVDLTPARSRSYCGPRCAASATVTPLHERRRAPETAGQASTAAV
jgi:predicted RNA-binding Zn ribbon-like protein